MNEDIRQKWMDALRSGEYKKAKTQLKDCDGHLSPGGILCELAVAEGIIGAPTDLTGKIGRKDPIFFGWTYEGEGVSIPREVAEWAEIGSRRVWSLDYKSDCGLTFDQAADYVESKF